MSSDSPEAAQTFASAAKDDDDETSKSQQASPSPTTSNKQDTLPTAVEFEPPLACVRRILKNTLPSSTNVGKDASSTFSRATGIFIIYLTSCANDYARENKRQTITANDVLAATKELEFDEFLPDMTQFLENYRAMEKSKKDAKAKAAADKADEKPIDDGADEEEDDDDNNESHDENEDHDGGRKRSHDELEVNADDETSHTGELVAKKLKTDAFADDEPDADQSPKSPEANIQTTQETISVEES
jgi:DNA polymerase epsilon subunit 3